MLSLAMNSRVSVSMHLQFSSLRTIRFRCLNFYSYIQTWATNTGRNPIVHGPRPTTLHGTTLSIGNPQTSRNTGRKALHLLSLYTCFHNDTSAEHPTPLTRWPVLLKVQVELPHQHQRRHQHQQRHHHQNQLLHQHQHQKKLHLHQHQRRHQHQNQLLRRQNQHQHQQQCLPFLPPKAYQIYPPAGGTQQQQLRQLHLHQNQHHNHTNSGQVQGGGRSPNSGRKEEDGKKAMHPNEEEKSGYPRRTRDIPGGTSRKMATANLGLQCLPSTKTFTKKSILMATLSTAP